MFTLEFKTDNAAFGEVGGDEYGDEVARILRAVADKIGGGFYSINGRSPVRDVNGNTVGSWELTATLED